MLLIDQPSLWNDLNYFTYRKHDKDFWICYMLFLEGILYFLLRFSQWFFFRDFHNWETCIDRKCMEGFEYMKFNLIQDNGFLCIDFKRGPSAQ